MNIELNQVDFSFRDDRGSEVSVLETMSLTIQSGKIAAIVGPSGCGKSTILKLAAGLLKPNKGGVFLDGIPAEQCRQAGAFGLVFQNPALLPWRTVAHNVRLPLELRGQTPNDKDVKKALEDVGLKAWSEQRPHELSGGMQQRVALARALVAKPKVLLLDEPFSQLDELLRFELLFQMLNYANAFGSTVMFVTHDVSEAVIAADVIYILSDRPVLSAERIDVLLPRPRTLLTTDQPLFHKLVSEVRTILKQQKCKV